MQRPIIPNASSINASATPGLGLGWRRVIMATLVITTLAGVVNLLLHVLNANGLNAWDWAMVGCFLLTAPWVVLGFWNTVIGFLLLRRQDWLLRVAPYLANLRHSQPLKQRTALVMPVYNESPERVFRHLKSMIDSLDATGEAEHFEFFLLSDTTQPVLQAEEESRFNALQALDRHPSRLHYRRRSDNSGAKVGNLEDFCQRWGQQFDHMLVLDADSLMSGTAVVRLARLMEANPNIGIIQTLVVGLPSLSPFARIFQFGMRQGMRPYTIGSAWWQADQGPFWGHNAIVRLEPFMAHCQLPTVPGSAPLGGQVLSHDQLEAALMCKAGFEVRVLPIEDGSFEENPPTLPDFMQRDLRWCQGNMQYTRLLNLPGLRFLGRVQLLLAILMYLSSPAWFGFMLIGLCQSIWGNGFASDNLTLSLGIGLFVVMMTMTFAPKIGGIVDLLCRKDSRAAYGGTPRILAGTVVELGFSLLNGPVVSLAHTVFIGGLFWGKQVHWDTQTRDSHTVPFSDAWRNLWPQTLLGLVGLTVLAVNVPSALPWAAPVIAGLLLAVPFACLTSWTGPGRLLARWQLCAIPEELTPPREVGSLDLPALAELPVSREIVDSDDSRLSTQGEGGEG